MYRSLLLHRALMLLDSATDNCNYPLNGPSSAEINVQIALAKAKIAEQLITIVRDVDNSTLSQVDGYEV